MKCLNYPFVSVSCRTPWAAWSGLLHHVAEVQWPQPWKSAGSCADNRAPWPVLQREHDGSVSHSSQVRQRGHEAISYVNASLVCLTLRSYSRGCSGFFFWGGAQTIRVLLWGQVIVNYVCVYKYNCSDGLTGGHWGPDKFKGSWLPDIPCVNILLHCITIVVTVVKVIVQIIKKNWQRTWRMSMNERRRASLCTACLKLFL